MIPAKASAMSKAILGFVYAHPHLSKDLHITLNAVPDIAYVLLALAGFSYLMPELTKKLEDSRTLRLTVFGIFAVFGLLWQLS